MTQPPGQDPDGTSADEAPAAASTSGRVSQSDLPFLPGFFNKRDQTVPCADFNLQLLRCYRDASPISFGTCKEEYQQFWDCMKFHQPAHKSGEGNNFFRLVRTQGWPWVKQQGQRLKELVTSLSGGGSSGGSTGS